MKDRVSTQVKASIVKREHFEMALWEGRSTVPGVAGQQGCPQPGQTRLGGSPQGGERGAEGTPERLPVSSLKDTTLDNGF